jgi:hypothetical protein
MGMSRGEKDACHAKRNETSFLPPECTPPSSRFLDVRLDMCFRSFPFHSSSLFPVLFGQVRETERSDDSKSDRSVKSQYWCQE